MLSPEAWKVAQSDFKVRVRRTSLVDRKDATEFSWPQSVFPEGLPIQGFVVALKAALD